MVNNKTHTNCKLLILYMLNKVSFMLNYSQLSELFLSKNYMGFLEFKTTIVELIESKLIEEKTTKNTQKYKITNNGIEALNFFINDVPLELIKEIDNYLTENRIKLRTESSITSEIEEIENNNYKIHLEINEDKMMLLNIEMELPDVDTADTMCENWKINAKDIYNFIIKKLV